MLPRDLCQWGRRSFLPHLDHGLEGRLGRIWMGETPLPTAWTQYVRWDEVRLRYRLQWRLDSGHVQRAGTIAPVDLSVPAVAGMKFSAVAEVHSSAVDVDDDTSVGRASEQRSDVSLDPRTAAVIVDRPMAGISVPEPLEHSVLDVDLAVDLWRGYQFRNH